MIIIQQRDVCLDSEEIEMPELTAGQTFGDDGISDISWTVFSMHANALDALCSFVAAINAEEVDDVNQYYRVIDDATGEIRGL
jgi:hypothetical protein